MPGLVPGIHVLLLPSSLLTKTWMAGTSASESDAVLRTAMPGHDDLVIQRLWNALLRDAAFV
jgi:hypothetical protein